MFTVASTLL